MRLSVERAVVAAADPEQFPESAEVRRLEYAQNLSAPSTAIRTNTTWLNYENMAPELGWRSPFQVAQEAYRQHPTQQQWVGFYVSSYGHPQDSHRFGLYRSLVGAGRAERTT